MVDTAIDAMRDYLEPGRTRTAAGASPRARATGDDGRGARGQPSATLLGADPGGIVFGPNMTTLTFAFTRARRRARWRPATRSSAPDSSTTRTSRRGGSRPRTPARRCVARAVRPGRPAGSTGRRSGRADRAADTRGSRSPGRRTRSGTIPDVAGDRRRRARGRGPRLRRRGPPRPAPGRSTSPRSAATCSRPPRTSGTARTPGCSGSRPSCATALTPYKVRPAPDTAPERFETGTPAYEAIAGTAAAAEFLLDRGHGRASPSAERARVRPAARRAARASPHVRVHGPGTWRTARRPSASRSPGAPPTRSPTRSPPSRSRSGAGATTRSRSWPPSGSPASGGAIRAGVSCYTTPGRRRPPARRGRRAWAE